MAVANYAQKINLDNIIVDREGRQRRVLEDIPELAAAIQSRGLLHPIIVDRESKKLIAGERRLTAYKHLRDQWNARAGTAEAEGEETEGKNPWSAIPYRYYDTVDGTEHKLIELEENIQRVELNWRDKALSLLEIHKMLSESKSDHQVSDTATYLRMNTATLYTYLTVAKELAAKNPLILEAESLREAHNKCKRMLDRAVGEQMNMMMAGGLGALAMPLEVPERIDVKPPENPPHNRPTLTGGAAQNAPGTTPPGQSTTATTANPTPVPAPVVPAPVPAAPFMPIIQADFTTWAPEYTGQPFNFLHCDFPYGINHQKSGQGRTAQYGAYDDQEDVYWHLLKVLADNKSRLLYPSAHLMFWFSMKFYRETMDFFDKNLPEFTIEECPLIWWKDRSIAPDTERRPRRAYESAFIGFSSNRKLVNTRSNIVQHPAGNKIHASEKPAGMLRQFFKMTVDSHTRMLDPTCGSGTAIRAAKSLGASHVLGLERDPEFAKAAQAAYLNAAMIGFELDNFLADTADVA